MSTMVRPSKGSRQRLVATLIVPFLLGFITGSMIFVWSGEKKILEETIAFGEKRHAQTEKTLQEKLTELEEAVQAKRELQEKVIELVEAVATATKDHADLKSTHAKTEEKLQEKRDKIAELEEAQADFEKRNSRAEAKIQEKRDKIAELEEDLEEEEKERYNDNKGHKQLEKKLQLKIDELEEAAAATNKGLEERRDLGLCMREKGGFRPIVVTVATKPRTDLLGAYTLPTLLLLAVAHKHHWSFEVLPAEGTRGEKQLQRQFEQGHDIDKSWGSGFIDANHREGYNPVEMNRVVHDRLGFFPKLSRDINKTEWITVLEYPPPGEKLEELCREGAVEENGILRCRIWLPGGWVSEVHDHDHNIIKRHILENGGYDSFFTKSLRRKLHEKYMKKNGHRVTHFSNSTYDVAMHVRRGDEVQSTHPDRWIEQPVYATIIRRICKEHPEAVIHVFSAGKNADGGFEGIEEAKDVCKNIVYHLDEVEFDTWAHFAAADEFVMSKSTFSYVPALFAGGRVHYPSDYWFGRLSGWTKYNSQSGEVM